MKLLIKNIKKLINVRDESPLRPLNGGELGILPTMDDAYLLVKDGIISSYGVSSSANVPELEAQCDKVVDAKGKMVFPSYCDSHTHLVYAGSREIEFMDKIRGLSYQEIARRGGGILNSVELLHNTSEADLLEQAKVRAQEIIAFGTGAVEIKSGYGLSLEDEI
jgi:imidazolonepropionase